MNKTPRTLPVERRPADLPAETASLNPAAPARQTVRVRILQAGPLGALGQERDDFTPEWVQDHIKSGAVELLGD